ncbi:CopG family transcriptional regulator [Halovenus marina]|uniref:CopG family transcriptional regulator n=1 Tax=Halovenus marina TaxID=3396621 RepID=UPI003F57C334
MSNKAKTISFRVEEEKFQKLQTLTTQQNLSLSSIFRDYVDTITAHEGRVSVVPEYEVGNTASQASNEFPLTVEIPKSVVREHEQLELECEHLREQLTEYQQKVSHLESELESEKSATQQMVYLEELDP